MTGVLARPSVPATPVVGQPGFAPGDATWPIELLWGGESPTQGPRRGGQLPADLAGRFGTDLVIPLHPGRSTIIANFVSTLDGVVALDRLGATGGREVSGAFEPDRFVMGLLRATADAVLVGAGTVRASRTGDWTPDRIHPPSAAAYARWRQDLGLSTAPATVIVTATGDLPTSGLRLAGPGNPILVVTTDHGAGRLRGPAREAGVDVVAVSDGGTVPLESLRELLHARGFSLVLSEAGPTLFGELLAARAVDELFLTLAPQVAGRAEASPRLGLVEGTAFAPAGAPWGRLRSVMRSADHLFLRYELPTSHSLPGVFA
jgi:riboflavin biosynthesis pyrimidine reductase